MELVLQRIQENRSGDCLEVYFKTSSKSCIAVYVMRFKNSEKKDDWRIKTNHFCVALRSAIVGFPCANPTVNDALLSIDYGLMRDTTQSPKTPVSNDWTSPKKKVYTYYEYVIHGHFSIPVESISSAEEETHYIESTCHEIGKTVLKVMQEEYFKPCYREAINRDNIWANIADDNNVNKQYWSWARNAQVKTIKCESLNRHLVLDEASNLVGKLYENNQLTTKYTQPGVIDDEDESSDSEDEKGAGKNNDDDKSTSSSHGDDYVPEAKTSTRTGARKRSEAKQSPKGDTSKTGGRAGKKSKSDAEETA